MVQKWTHAIGKDSWYGNDNTHDIVLNSWYSIGTPESHTYPTMHSELIICIFRFCGHLTKEVSNQGHLHILNDLLCVSTADQGLFLNYNFSFIVLAAVPVLVPVFAPTLSLTLAPSFAPELQPELALEPTADP